MRVLIDTNVLISAALSANGIPFQAYVKAASYPNHGLICEQNVDDACSVRGSLFPAAHSCISYNFPISTPFLFAKVLCTFFEESSYWV